MAYSTINKSSNFQNNVQYTGNNTGQSITGVGFQPDIVWNKSRSNSESYNIWDAVRGIQSYLTTNTGDAVSAGGSTGLSSYDADGWTMGSLDSMNDNAVKFIAWCFKMGTTSGIAGSPSITPTAYSFNATAGQSIIQWTGTEAVGTLPHGLGVAPELILVKTLASGSWYIYHKSLGADEANFLNDSGVPGVSTNYWNDTAPDANLFTVGVSSGTNDSGQSMMAYCFSGANTNMFKAGKYTGNGNADGTFVYTGFRPSLIFFKRTDATSNWRSINNKDGFNGDIGLLHPNLSDQESAGDNAIILSNGFKFRNNSSDWNGNQGEYVYFAWGQPIVSNSGVPVPAWSGGIPT